MPSMSATLISNLSAPVSGAAGLAAGDCREGRQDDCCFSHDSVLLLPDKVISCAVERIVDCRDSRQSALAYYSFKIEFKRLSLGRVIVLPVSVFHLEYVFSILRYGQAFELASGLRDFLC